MTGETLSLAEAVRTFGISQEYMRNAVKYCVIHNRAPKNRKFNLSRKEIEENIDIIKKADRRYFKLLQKFIKNGVHSEKDLKQLGIPATFVRNARSQA